MDKSNSRIVDNYMNDNTQHETSLEATDVARYLARHPDFFLQHGELLAELELPHDSGSAISLVERQVAVLRDRNMDMRHRLSHLLDNARDNDRLFDKTKRLILELLDSQDLGDLVNALHYSFDQDFNVHYTRLLLIGHPEKLPASQARVITPQIAKDNIAGLLRGNRAFCGTLSDQERVFIFDDAATQVGSAATVPLVHGATVGLLAVGNRDPKYYRSSMGTLFLGYIAEILNRLLPRYLPQ